MFSFASLYNFLHVITQFYEFNNFFGILTFNMLKIGFPKIITKWHFKLDLFPEKE